MEIAEMAVDLPSLDATTCPVKSEMVAARTLRRFILVVKMV